MNPPNQPQVIQPRWLYRLDNYKRAFVLLREGITTMEERPLSQLEKEGVIQRFEYTWELAWKLLKDYLEVSGVVLAIVTPATVIKAAFAAKLIDDGDGWMQALDARNKMSHTYDVKVFEQIIQEIRSHHLTLLDRLYRNMVDKADGEGRARP